MEIILYVRWYLRYSLSYRDLAEMMAEPEPFSGSVHDLEMGAVLCAGTECADRA
jgi:hypothetical protein